MIEPHPFYASKIPSRTASQLIHTNENTPSTKSSKEGYKKRGNVKLGGIAFNKVLVGRKRVLSFLSNNWQQIYNPFQSQILHQTCP
jgi:hypothetical protein